MPAAGVVDPKSPPAGLGAAAPPAGWPKREGVVDPDPAAGVAGFWPKRPPPAAGVVDPPPKRLPPVAGVEDAGGVEVAPPPKRLPPAEAAGF